MAQVSIINLCVHTVAPAGSELQRPARHFVHSFSALCGFGSKRPAGQVIQLDFPSFGWCLPAGHAVHALRRASFEVAVRVPYVPL